MGNIHVIILAQGRQERMGDSTGGLPKQLLPLPACGGVPILVRTLHQVKRLLAKDLYRITLVSWHEVHQACIHWPPGSKPTVAHAAMMFEAVSLADPGNSALKGIHRYLDQLELTVHAERPDRTVVLLGDVVYSWRCLEAIFADLANAIPDGVRCRFVGTDDISPSGGELWGIAWDHDANSVMLRALEYAIQRHPPYQDTYQPGQLRRWMWALHPAFQTTSRYRRIDDYTRDIDLPEHVQLLPALSCSAAADDLEHGVTW